MHQPNRPTARALAHRAVRRSFPGRAMAALLLALGCGACTATSGQAPGPVAAAKGPTVAFESIDGPPQSVFSHLVQSLTAEAQARQVAVVSRAAPAQYRVRVYAATVVEPKRSVVSWVWDVYDQNRQRAFRLAGEEPVTGAGRTTWAAADEQVIQKIAGRGMEQLVAAMAQPTDAQAPQPAPAAQPDAPEKAPPVDDKAVTVAAFASAPAGE